MPKRTSEFGALVISHLSQRNMSQRALAQALNLSAPYLSATLHNKRPSGAFINRVGEALHLSEGEIVDLHIAAARDQGYRVPYRLARILGAAAAAIAVVVGIAMAPASAQAVTDKDREEYRNINLEVCRASLPSNPHLNHLPSQTLEKMCECSAQGIASSMTMPTKDWIQHPEVWKPAAKKWMDTCYSGEMP